MAATITLYDHTWDLVAKDLNLATATLRLKIVSSGYVFDATHTAWDSGTDDADDPSYNEVANGDGYTTGGQALAGVTVANGKMDADDVTWTSLSKTFRGLILVAVGTYSSVVDPVLFYLLPDSTPADTVSSGSDYSVIWNATDGIFYQPSAI